MRVLPFPEVARRACAVVAVLAGALLPLRAAAQPALRTTWEGPFDYVVTGATLRDQSNTADPCDVSTSRSATLSGIPSGATVEAAILLWAGSGSLDANVTFNGNSAGALRTATAPFNFNGNNYSFFSGVRDVTALVNGNGTYTLSNLSVTNNSFYCTTQAVMSGWALVVVYRQTGLPLRRIQLHDGLVAVREGSSTINLTGFTAAATPDVQLTVLAYEGDPDQVGTGTFPERVRWNGANISADNAFNSTISSLGVTNSYGVDLDTYTPTLASGATSASLALLSGPDLVLWQAAVTSIALAPALGVTTTPDGLAEAVRRLPGAGYSQPFVVTSTGTSSDTYDLIAGSTGSPGFVTIDSIRGTGVTATSRPDSARSTIASGASRTVTVWYRVSMGTPADNNVTLRARSTTASTTLDDGFAQVRRVIPQLTLSKQVNPQNTLSPGTELTYTLQFQNLGEFAAVGVAVSDSVPPQVTFKLGSPGQTLPAGVTATVGYSNDGGATWTYAPVSGGCGAPAGYDACVRRIRWTLAGSLPPGAAASTGTLTFVARIR